MLEKFEKNFSNQRNRPQLLAAGKGNRHSRLPYTDKKAYWQKGRHDSWKKTRFPLYDENGNLLEETYMLDEDMGELEEEEERMKRNEN